MERPIIAPSILAADFGNLAKDIQMIEKSAAQWVHVDIMDGVFVPNISFGFPIMDVVKKNTTKFIDVHLMIANPSQYLAEFIKRGADGISIHFEGNLHVHSDLQQIRKLGAKSGLVLNPHTPVSIIKDIIHEIDTLLIMSVNPGFGGQKFIPHSLEKIKEAKALIKSTSANTIIQVDGGVGLTNIQDVLNAGADVMVAGSAVFKSENPMETICSLKNTSIS